jgi:hypothetical protein
MIYVHIGIDNGEAGFYFDDGTLIVKKLPESRMKHSLGDHKDFKAFMIARLYRSSIRDWLHMHNENIKPVARAFFEHRLFIPKGAD